MDRVKTYGGINYAFGVGVQSIVTAQQPHGVSYKVIVCSVPGESARDRGRPPGSGIMKIVPVVEIKGC